MTGKITDNLLIVPWGAIDDINTPKIKIINDTTNTLIGKAFKWNSQTGLLYQTTGGNSPIKYTGNLLARIPVGVTPNPGVTYRKMYL